MIKLPARPDGRWTVVHGNDKLPDIIANRNLTFDKEGYIKLSKPTASFFSEVDDADFGVPVGFFVAGVNYQYFVLTEEYQFELDMFNSGNYGSFTCTQNASTDTPGNTVVYSPSSTVFNQKISYANPTDRKLYTFPGASAYSNSWTVNDISASLESSSSLSCCTFVSNSTIAIGNDNQVDQFNTSYTVGTQLQLPDDYAVTGLAYNNGYLGITTHAKDNFSRCMFYVWDGKTTAANYVIEVPSVTSYSPVAYMGSFVFLSGNGILYLWSPTSLTPLAALPTYYNDATFSIGAASNNFRESIVSDGKLIHINIRSKNISLDENLEIYNAHTPGGIWTYDPGVGLYHRHAPTGTKIIQEAITTSSVNTTNDQLTVSTAYPTGTPVRYVNNGGTTMTGLTSNKLYYVIYVDSTHIQLADSYNDAIAGTEIDLTGTGNNSQALHYYLKPDFGQSYTIGRQGALYLEGTKGVDSDLFFQKIFYGAECALKSTTEYDVGGLVLQDSENRGYLITSRLRSEQLQEDWQKIFIKHSPLITGLDKIVVKYRTSEPRLLVKINKSSAGLITWTDSNTFTSTDTQWASVVAGDEVEFIQGAGSGYLVHVSSISEAGGTYTVNIDEDIKNIAASDTGRAIASRWKKLTTLDNGIISNDDGYSEIIVGVKSKQIQFKIELRGEDVEVEEILVAHQLHKPVA